ncbi:renalase-like isoform X1 [Argonauta hians]
MSSVSRVLIVGAGISGALTAALLRRELSHVHISVWEKARGAGGRMSTSRSDKNAACRVDMGAQYISTTPLQQQKYAHIYEELFSEGLLRPFTGRIEGEHATARSLENLVCPGGFSQLVKHYLDTAAPVDVKFGTRVTSISKKSPTQQQQQPPQTSSSSSSSSTTETTPPPPPPSTSTTSDQFLVSTECGHSETFDVVVLTIPVPQLFLIEGDIPQILNSNCGLKERLHGVTYSSRFCLGMYYPPGTSLDIPWTAKYINGHPCVRYVCVDSRKRGLTDSTSGESILVHTSVPWGVSHVEESKDEMGVEILGHMRELYPGLPQPDFIKGHKWRYSQVQSPYPGSPGCLSLSTSPLLLLGGDGMSYSKFEGCIDSATALVTTMLQQQQQQ